MPDIRGVPDPGPGAPYLGNQALVALQGVGLGARQMLFEGGTTVQNEGFQIVDPGGFLQIRLVDLHIAEGIVQGVDIENTDADNDDRKEEHQFGTDREAVPSAADAFHGHSKDKGGIGLYHRNEAVP